MKIYIASSWKNQHAVEMLTTLLRRKGHDVLSFVENEFGEYLTGQTTSNFEKWVKTEAAKKSFEYDTNAALTSDLIIYISPSGKDAAAECGMSYAKGIPILGLYAKGEDFGLMRKMMAGWYKKYIDILDVVEIYDKTGKIQIQWETLACDENVKINISCPRLGEFYFNANSKYFHPGSPSKQTGGKIILKPEIDFSFDKNVSKMIEYKYLINIKIEFQNNSVYEGNAIITEYNDNLLTIETSNKCYFNEN